MVDTTMYFWETSILGNETKKEKDSDKTYVAYKLVVQDTAQSWTLERRYSDFYALHTRLKEKFSESQLPPIPSKGLFFSNNDPKFIKERSMALEKLLLKKDSPTCQCGEVIDFLDPNRKSSLNSSLPIPLPPKNCISPLPPTPPRLFMLNPESIFLQDGEECFLPQFFDHIAESLKYLVMVDSKISSAPNTQAKMNNYELEKERIHTTIETLREQLRVTNQIVESSISRPPTFNQNNSNNQSNYNNYNDYSNVYHNPYTSNPYPHNPHPNNNYNNNPYNNNNNYNNRPVYNHPPPNQYNNHQNNAYPPRSPLPYYNPPQQYPPDYYVVVNGRAATAPLQSSGGIPTGGEGPSLLSSYLDTCLHHIQEAIIWESGLESDILAECANTSSWCEVQERLKWFDAECEKLIVGSLGVSLGKEAKKELKKKITGLRDQASRYLEELTENPKHKCGLNPSSEIDHINECKDKLKKTIDFIKENRKRLSGSSAEEIVVKYETKLFQVLEDIANLENATYNTSDERKEYKDKSSDIKKRIASIMKHVSDFRVDLQDELKKLHSHDGDKSKVPDENILHSLINRLEDLQANLADLSHDFSKALEIAQRNTLGGILKERQFEDAKKVHGEREDDMFEL